MAEICFLINHVANMPFLIIPVAKIPFSYKSRGSIGGDHGGDGGDVSPPTIKLSPPTFIGNKTIFFEKYSNMK